MGSRGQSSNTSMRASSATVVTSKRAATMANNQAFGGGSSNANMPASQMTPQQLQQYFLNQAFTIDQKIAAMNYVSDVTESGSLYSMSQNMNHNLAHGNGLTANQQFVYDNLMSAMHDMGGKFTATRYDHDGSINNLLNSLGINQSYDTLSEAQLKQALVGQTIQEKKLVSASLNDFATAPQRTQNVFTNRAVKYHYTINPNAKVVVPGDGPGGKLEEIIFAPTTSTTNGYKITDVKLGKKNARRKGTQSYNAQRIDVWVEIG